MKNLLIYSIKKKIPEKQNRFGNGWTWNFYQFFASDAEQEIIFHYAIVLKLFLYQY